LTHTRNLNPTTTIATFTQRRMATTATVETKKKKAITIDVVSDTI